MPAPLVSDDAHRIYRTTEEINLSYGTVTWCRASKSIFAGIGMINTQMRMPTGMFTRAISMQPMA